METLREQFDAAFLSANGFHTKAELANEWEKGLSGHMFRAGAAARGVPRRLTDEQWFAKYGHEAHCNLMFAATSGTADDYCDCKAAVKLPPSA